MSNLRRVPQVFVTNTEGANTGTTSASIAVGDVLILNQAGAALTGTPTVTSAADNAIIRVALGITNPDGSAGALISNPINLATRGLKKVTKAAYSVPTDELLTFGFDGSSSTLPTPANSTEYMLKILIKDDQRQHGNKPTTQTYNYTTDASASAAELAFGLVKQVQRDCYSGNTNSYVFAWVLTNGNITALTNNATVTQFSNRIVSTAHGLAVGDLVRIGGTAATVPVYKVSSIVDANTFTVEGLYMGTSGTVLAANINLLDTVTSYGFQLKGRDTNTGRFYYETYSKVYFTAGLGLAENLGISPLIAPVVTTPTFEGIGFWRQVRDLDLDALSYEGITTRTSWYENAGINATTRVVSGNTYNLVTIEFDNQGYLGTQYASEYPEQLIVAFYSSSAPTNSTKQTNFLATLESLAESVQIFVQ
jgi:hypothetical protein